MAAFYEEVFDALEAARVRYVVVGGLAVILHGVPRTTADVDLVLDLERDNVLRFVEALEKLGFRPRAPVAARQLADEDARREWIEQKHLKAFTMTRGGLDDVDVLLDAPLDHAALSKSSVTLSAAGVTLEIAGLESLITLKRHADRAQDRADVAALQRILELDDG